MNLIVDIGNTLIKLALFHQGRCVAQLPVEQLNPGALDYLLGKGSVERAIVCSTRGRADEELKLLAQRADRVMELTWQTPVPIRSIYRTPKTLGSDRLAAAVGATVLYPGRNVLLVDFGTAVTIDLVTADATFCGGCISPGLSMRLRALHEYTARLPLCVPTGSDSLLGLTTEESIRQGVMNSLTFEIEGYIARLRERYDDLCVIFTGGDANYFVKRIKYTIFASCNPVFCGLDRILEYNAREESIE